MDREKKEMLRTRRWLPLSTSTFNYDSYHNLAEVRKKTQDSGHFKGKNDILELLSQSPLLHEQQGQGMSQA